MFQDFWLIAIIENIDHKQEEVKIITTEAEEEPHKSNHERAKS